MKKGKIALITGATAGIGEASAHLLAAEGYNLIINGRRVVSLRKLEARLREKYGIDVLSLPFDIQSRNELERAICGLSDEWSQIDLLVNNAGLAAGLADVYDADWNDWEQMIDTNVKGLVNLCRLITPMMVKRESGHIINITSIAGKEVYNKGSVYCASKHAVDAFTKGLRIDLAPYNIKVTSIAPGAVNTEFSLVRFKGDQEKADQVYDGFEPLLARDIAEAIIFVVSRPPHVNINDMLIMPTAQANATTLIRK